MFVLLEGGVTDEIRRQCTDGELVCPMADCPDPLPYRACGTCGATTSRIASRTSRTPTSAVWRTEAMTMLADWVGLHRGAEVETENRDGLARVRVQSQRSGRQVELRVTYDRRRSVSATFHVDVARVRFDGQRRACDDGRAALSSAGSARCGEREGCNSAGAAGLTASGSVRWVSSGSGDGAAVAVAVDCADADLVVVLVEVLDRGRGDVADAAAVRPQRRD